MGNLLIELIESSSLFLSHGGWGLLMRSCYPSSVAYDGAVRRLSQRGLLVQRQGVHTPILKLSDFAQSTLPAYFDPEKWWRRSWNGLWYVLVYDVPEENRIYRNTLRRFLQRLRMGGLQNSVWLSCMDIRPDFDDLCTAAALSDFAYLFEARTVLGLPTDHIVEKAWRMSRLLEIQQQYCTLMTENLTCLKQQAWSMNELLALVSVVMDAYHGVFSSDPLLPAVLWPKGYQGQEVLALHRSLLQAINGKLMDNI
jgi:phenylacetic acid degradation operon negative regulatory protein